MKQEDTGSSTMPLSAYILVPTIATHTCTQNMGGIVLNFSHTMLLNLFILMLYST